MRKALAIVSCFLVGIAVVLVARNACQIQWYWFAPGRPSNRPGWESVRKLDVVYVGKFVLNEGESTEDGGIGVTVLGLQPPPCPAPQTFDTDGSRARFRIYRTSDRQVLCELNLEQSSTSYEVGHFCEASLPFREISVDSVNAGEGWVSFSLFNLDATGK